MVWVDIVAAGERDGDRLGGSEGRVGTPDAPPLDSASVTCAMYAGGAVGSGSSAAGYIMRGEGGPPGGGADAMVAMIGFLRGLGALYNTKKKLVASRCPLTCARV